MRELRTVFIEITDKCNKICKHCFNGQTNNSTGGEISPSAFQSLIRSLKCNGAMQLKIVGGEPMIHSKIDIIIDILESEGIPYIIYTDHERILEVVERLRTCKALQNIRVSFDGIQETHDSIRLKGDFNKMCHVVRCLQDKHIRTFMNFTINRRNYQELREIWTVSRGLETEIKFGIIKCYQNVTQKDKLVFSEQEVSLFLNEMCCIKQENMELYRAIWSGIDDDNDFIQSQKHEQGQRHIGCFAGQRSCVIDTNGNIWPCALLKGNEQFIYGNALYGDLEESWEKMNKEWSCLQKNFSCHNCKYMQSCTGGCRANAFYAGDLNGKDPNCLFYCNNHQD